MEDEAWRSLMVRFETHLAAEKGLAALTVRNYKTDLQPLFDFMRLRDVGGLDALDRYALRAYLAWLVELGYVRASVVRKLSTLRTFLRWLIREKELDKDPAAPARSHEEGGQAAPVPCPRTMPLS